MHEDEMDEGRGIRRGLYAALVDNPDFQTLSPPARHVLLTMRVSKDCGPACIWQCYPSTVAHQTGLALARVEFMLKELAEAGWIQRETGLVWIINGLRYDPNMNVK